MEMLRNREFRQFAVIFFLIAAASVTLGFANNMAAGILALFSSFAFGTAFFVFTKARYKSLMQISEQIDLVLHNADHLFIAESEEGELSILQSEITKMMLRIREQNDALKKEKEHLADSLADVAHQLRTPLTSITLVLSLIENTSDEKERKNLIRETEELLVRMDWLLTSLLKLSRLDAGIVVFQKEQVNINSLITAALQPLQIPMERHNISLQADVPPGITIDGDSTGCRKPFRTSSKTAWKAQAIMEKLISIVRTIPFLRKSQFMTAEQASKKKTFQTFLTGFTGGKIPAPPDME